MNQENPCNNFLPSLFLYIDNEIDDSVEFNTFTTHFQECLPCHETMESERSQVLLLRQLLNRSCFEEAPSTLHEAIADAIDDLHQQFLTEQLAGAGQTEIITQYHRTEITIDGEIQIEIETSHEIRRDFPF